MHYLQSAYVTVIRALGQIFLVLSPLEPNMMIEFGPFVG